MWRFLSVLILIAIPAWSANIFVDPNNPEGFATIGEAIQEADEGDVIFVAEGFYPEKIEIDKNLHLIGVGAELTILSYAQSGNAIDITADADTTTLIEGFTITGKGGVGIAIADGGSATIRSCVLTHCGAEGIQLSNSASIIQLNQFIGNQTGALYLYQDQGSVITNNIFKDAVAGRYDNYQGWYGTVLIREQASNTLFANNLLKGNNNTQWGTVYCLSSNPTIKNNVIVENLGHGVLLAGNAAPLITSNIIMDNTGYGIYMNSSTPVITYNNVYNNTSEDYFQVAPDIGDISKDPRFTDLRNDDYSLSEGSPSIDTGTPGAASSDLDGTRNDMGMFGGPFARFWEAPYTGPVITSLEATPSRVQQGATITVRASGTTVRE